MPKRILIIEDNAELVRLLALNLSDPAHEVDTAADGPEGLAKAARTPYDLIILDLMLPGLDGLEVCRRLRERDRYVPVLMLTARSQEMERVAGLETGADDYVTKPFSIAELKARIHAIFRRVEQLRGGDPPRGPARITTGGLAIDRERRTVTRDGKPVALTAKEFDLLLHFAENPGRVFTRSQLLDAVWGYGHDGYEHTVNSHINRLRAKIERDPGQPRQILTVWGVGYRFAEEGGR